MISFKPLWVTLAERGMKKSDLYAVTSTATVSRMGKNEYVSLEVIDRICTFLNCDVSAVIKREE